MIYSRIGLHIVCDTLHGLLVCDALHGLLVCDALHGLLVCDALQNGLHVSVGV